MIKYLKNKAKQHREIKMREKLVLKNRELFPEYTEILVRYILYGEIPEKQPDLTI